MMLQSLFQVGVLDKEQLGNKCGRFEADVVEAGQH